MLISMKVESPQRQQSWVRGSLIVAGLLALPSCADDSAPQTSGAQIIGGETTAPKQVENPVPVQVGTGDAAQPKSSSGNIKSFFEETEQEPPLLTGSIFANGFTLADPLGAAGAAATPLIANPVQQLGLGNGDLTVLILFDRSISMSEEWEGLPRWQVAGRAFMNGMAGFEDLVTLGTIFFPQAADCDVAPLSDPRQIQFQAGTRFKQQWEAYPQNRFPSGGTPLGPAFEEADKVIQEALGYGLLGAGRRFRVAVITDGKPNCGTDPDRVLQLATSWTALGVELHVIGLPGSSEASEFLNELAAKGGTTGYRAPVDQQQAEQELNVLLK